MIRCPVCKYGMLPKSKYRRDRKMKCPRCGYEYNPQTPNIVWRNWREY